jgi:hypothetical protein
MLETALSAGNQGLVRERVFLSDQNCVQMHNQLIAKAQKLSLVRVEPIPMLLQFAQIPIGLGAVFSHLFLPRFSQLSMLGCENLIGKEKASFRCERIWPCFGSRRAPIKAPAAGLFFCWS